ncbi:hypothetical protein ABID97_002433 [Variovorax sp. OAS795]|uniref:hypothetical protein n=1 Tax=Variovorax sp. OAS795 TaxID=3034231 RepID=UPI0033940866
MNKNLLHDWTLVRVDFEWKSGQVTIELEDSTLTRRVLVAEAVQELRVPKMNEWGPSVSVNEVTEGEASSGHGKILNIEMQSGDVIRIVAEKIFLLPA